LNGTYAFRFSGYDNSGKATAAAGTFTASNGTISTGVEGELTSSGFTQHTITGGSFNPIPSSNANSNNAGILTLTGASPGEFRAVLDGNGDIEMIEDDGSGAGSGVAQVSAPSNVFKGNGQTYAFGFSGVDSNGKRVGYVGVLPLSGNGTSGTVTGGQIDVNDNGNSSNSVCGNPPCSVAGSYAQNGSGWRLTLTSPVAMTFDFYIASGSGSKGNPLNLYAISTDPGSNPAVSGTMVLQDSSQTYNTAAFSGVSVSALTGTAANGTNVSLTLGTTDGSGNFSGQFDQNDAGTILSAIQFPGSSTSYTYAASGTGGRYTFNMLGDPATSTPPVPFILYASGANRGFLLDQSSPSVMTGTMIPQGNGSGVLGPSDLASTFAAATTSSGGSGVDPLAANLLLKYDNTGNCSASCVNLSGTQYDTNHTGGTPLTGQIAPNTFMSSGTGPVALTAPSAGSYVIYAVDTSGACSFQNPVCQVQDFLMMDETTSDKNPSIIFVKQ
jgi:hypothetical protein